MNIMYNIILRPKKSNDSKGYPITDVLVINKFTLKSNPDLTKYNLTFYNANIYKYYLQENCILNWIKYKEFDEFKKELERLNKVDKLFQEEYNNYLENPTKYEESLLFPIEYEDEISKNYLNMINHPEWFIVDETLYKEDLENLMKYLSNFNSTLLRNIKDLFLFSTLYGTTDMEKINISETWAKDIYLNKRGVKDIKDLQFKNNQKSFSFVDKIQGTLNVWIIKSLHTIWTAGLDAMESKINTGELDYNPWMFRTTFVHIQWQYKTPHFPDLSKIINKILSNTYQLKGLSKIIYFHLSFYLLHPFQNWNKRTTRSAEYKLFQEEFLDYYKSFIGMPYYFYTDMDSFYSMISAILFHKYSEIYVKNFVSYYSISFQKMIKQSIREIKIKAEVNTLEEKWYSLRDKDIAEFLMRNENFDTNSMVNKINKKIWDKTQIFQKEEFLKYFRKFKKYYEIIKIENWNNYCKSNMYRK